MASRPSRPIWELPDSITSVYHRFDALDPIKRFRYVLLSLSISLLWVSMAMPAAAQLEELGSAVCGSGAGWIITVLFIAGAVYLIVKGVLRAIEAIDDIGSTYEQTREEGRQEAKGAVFTFGGGLVGVPFLGGFLYQVLPEELNCLGIDFSFITVTPIEVVEPVMILVGL